MLHYLPSNEHTHVTISLCYCWCCCNQWSPKLTLSLLPHKTIPAPSLSSLFTSGWHIKRQFPVYFLLVWTRERKRWQINSIQIADEYGFRDTELWVQINSFVFFRGQNSNNTRESKEVQIFLPTQRDSCKLNIIQIHLHFILGHTFTNTSACSCECACDCCLYVSPVIAWPYGSWEWLQSTHNCMLNVINSLG